MSEREYELLMFPEYLETDFGYADSRNQFEYTLPEYSYPEYGKEENHYDDEYDWDYEEDM